MPRSVLERSPGLKLEIELASILLEQQTAYQHLLIAETVAYGRALFLDGFIQSTETDEALYHEPLVHPALVLHGTPRRVLVAGAGEGATLREILRHPSVEQIVAVDLDEQVIAASREYLTRWHAGAFDDPRVDVRLQDARDVLRDTDRASVDAVIVDLTEPIEGNPSDNVLTAEFFAEVSRVLTEEGVVAIQAGELSFLHPQGVRAVWSAVAEVFGWQRLAYTFLPSFHSMWAFVIASNAAPATIPEDLSHRIAALDGLRVYDENHHRTILHPPSFIRAHFEHQKKTPRDRQTAAEGPLVTDAENE